MKAKIVTAILVTLFVAGMFIVLPVVAGPNKAKGNNIIHIPLALGYEYAIIVSNRGWRQWYYNPDGEIVHFAVCLYTDGMNQKAIDAHIAGGWIEHGGLPNTNPRYDFVGGGAFIYKYHTIPAGP